MNQKILYRFFRGEANTAEQQALMDWLDADSDHRQQFDRERSVYNALLLHGPEQEHHKGISISWRKVARYTAEMAAALILCAGLSWMYIDQKQESWEHLMTHISAPEGQRISLTLQDGTKVWLNSEASLEYPALFADDLRRVSLKGEALFDVSKDKERPFIVDTYACEVEVLGTKFNVNANKENHTFTTMLIDGSVKVSSHNDNQHVILRPNQRVKLLSNGHLMLTESNDANEYLWAEDLIQISGHSFEEMMERLEMCYGVEIEVRLQQIPELQAMGKIRISDGLDHALDILKRNCKFNYTFDHDTKRVIIY